MTSRLTILFKDRFGELPTDISLIQAHASYRKIYRVKSLRYSSIGVIHDSKGENKAFIEFARHFRSFGLPVPEIYGENLDAGVYLQEDLGDETLFDLLSREAQKGVLFSSHTEALYREILKILPQFQITAGRTLDYSLCVPKAEYDRESMVWDMHYFRDSFLKRSDISFDTKKLDEEFQEFATFLASAPRTYFVYRDLQARNIMVREDKPFFIDFQSGRRGPLYYDLATLLFHPKATIPSEARERLLKGYREELARYERVPDDEFNRYFSGFVVLQFLHRFGTYGRFGIGAGKRYFAESIPKAIRILDEFFKTETLPCAMPELQRIFQSMITQPRYFQEGDPRMLCADPNILHIKIGSFAYKGGIPALDATPTSGGGFVFDCRSLPNPGREEAYKKKTGRDAEVCEYLESKKEVEEFYAHILALVEGTVRTYLERKFTELVIGFGCTGGQHRSVYCSERLKKDLIMKYPVKVTLTHRELVTMGYPVEES